MAGSEFQQQRRSPRHDPRRRFGSAWRNLADVLLVHAGLADPGPRASLSAVEHLRQRVSASSGGDAGLSFLKAGKSSGPRIILVHGSPGSAAGWADYLLDPPHGTEVVAVDRPGFGHSTADCGTASLAAQAEAVQALLPSNGRPVVLLGHSLGGAVVAYLAAMLPRRIQSIVLLASALDPALEVVHPLQLLANRWPLRTLLPRALRNSNSELLRLRADLALLQPMLPAVTAKVVVMHGTGDDLVPVANVAFMEQHFRGAQSVHSELLEGHNHFLPWNSMVHVQRALHVALEATS